MSINMNRAMAYIVTISRNNHTGKAIVFDESACCNVIKAIDEGGSHFTGTYIAKEDITSIERELGGVYRFNIPEGTEMVDMRTGEVVTADSYQTGSSYCRMRYEDGTISNEHKAIYLLPNEWWGGKTVEFDDYTTAWVRSVENGMLKLYGKSKSTVPDEVSPFDITVNPNIEAGHIVRFRDMNCIRQGYEAGDVMNMFQSLIGIDISLRRPYIVTESEDDDMDVIISDGKNRKYVNRNLLYIVSDNKNEGIPYFDFTDIRQGDAVAIRTNHLPATVLMTHNGAVLIMMKNDGQRYNWTTATFNLGNDPDCKYLWVTWNDINFINHNSDFRVARPSMTTSIKDALASYISNTKSFNVGDTITIRSVEDMINEFGSKDNGEPKTRCRFTSSMHHLCGRTATITAIDQFGHITLADWSDPENTNFVFSTEMCEGYVINKISRNALSELLSEYEVGCTAHPDISELPDLCYAVGFNGGKYQFLKVNGVPYYKPLSRADGEYEYLNNAVFDNLDIACIVKEHCGNLNIRSGNSFIWKKRPQITITDVELLTGVKVID